VLQDLGAFTTAHGRVLNVQGSNLGLREVVVKKTTVIEFGLNNGDDNGSP